MFRLKISKPGSYPHFVCDFPSLDQARQGMKDQARLLVEAMQEAQPHRLRLRTGQELPKFVTHEYDLDHFGVQKNGLNAYLLNVVELI